MTFRRAFVRLLGYQIATGGEALAETPSSAGARVGSIPAPDAPPVASFDFAPAVNRLIGVGS